MADSYPGKLQIWDGWKPTRIEPPLTATKAEQRPLAPPLDDSLAALYARETFHRGNRTREGAEPFSLQWYLDVEAARYARQGAWIPRLLEFTKHNGETLLGVGAGLGTDWLQYARHGARVVTCTPTAELQGLVQRNFELRGLAGQFLTGSAQALPVESASIDVVCLSSLLQPGEEPAAVVEEVYRVLKPGGKVLAVAPARYDVDYWCRDWLPWYGRARSQAPPGFSGRGLKRFFARFVELQISKRHLRRSEMPHLWRWLPLPLLERLFGRMLVLRAFKPLSAAIPAAPLAA
jgi:ubiquinone/menaquinone biosynthesis C-methylase UbiE